MDDDRVFRHASFFSGIGGFDVGFEAEGFETVCHAEVKPYSCAVLETHWPDVPNLGDINAICPDGDGDHECEIPRADVWTGGFPCSDFSVMGKRKGLLDGKRSSLGLVFLDLVRRHRPRFVVLENVPGLLTSHSGRDLGLLLGGLVDIGYGWAYRLLDARDFGLPQARRRVFIVAALDERDAGTVLDDRTDRGLDAPKITSAGRAALARGRVGADRRDRVVLGPTYAPGSDAVQRDGTTFTVTPNNYQYVLDDESGGPVFQLATRRGPILARDDGAAYTLLPTEGQHVVVIKRKGYDEGSDARDDGASFTVQPGVGRDDQYVVEEPTVLRLEGTFDPQYRRDGSTFTILPAGTGGRSNIGQQFVIRDGRYEPIVVYPTFSKRDNQRLASRDDGATYTLLPGLAPYVLELADDDFDDWPDDRDVGDRGLRRGDDGRGVGDRADVRPLASSGGYREDRDDGSDGPRPEDNADGVRATSGASGWLDDRLPRGDREMGPVHLDTARWHVLGRTVPVPIVQWIAAGVRAVLESEERENDIPLEGRQESDRATVASG